jgi:lipopolysaccharide export system protein LptC
VKAGTQVTLGPGARPPYPPRRRAHGLTMTPRARARSSDAYSHFVGAMKVVLPLLAAGLVALVLAWPHLKAKDLRFRIGFSALQAKVTEEPSMLNPRYQGVDKDKQPFTITADLAHNVVPSSAKVELEMPKADITLKDGSWLVLSAETGVYGRESQTLELFGRVNLYHDSGYEVRTEKAKIELDRGAAHGNALVHGEGPFGNIDAEGFRIIDKGRTIFFLGKSRLVLHPGTEVR